MIQLRYLLTRVYTPGYPSSPHPAPQLTTPIFVMKVNERNQTQVQFYIEQHLKTILWIGMI